jgi:hypothetical protein
MPKFAHEKINHSLILSHMCVDPLREKQADNNEHPQTTQNGYLVIRKDV